MERHGLFAGVPANKLGRLVPACRVKRYAGVPIKCACPDALHDAYIGLEGTTAITYELAGLEHVVELAGFGVVYNVGGLAGTEQSHRSARALGEVEVLAIDCELLHEVLDSDPSLSAPIFKNLSKLVIKQSDRHLEHVLTGPS